MVHRARHEEIDELEDLYRRVADGEHEATEVDELRCIEIAAGYLAHAWRANRRRDHR